MDLDDPSYDESSSDVSGETTEQENDPEAEISDLEDLATQTRSVNDNSLGLDYSTHITIDSVGSTSSNNDNNENNLNTNDDQNNSRVTSAINLRTDEINTDNNSEDSDIVFVQSVEVSSGPQVFTVNSDSESSDLEPIVVRAPVRNSHHEEIEIMEVTVSSSNSVTEPQPPASSTIIAETNSPACTNKRNVASDPDNSCIICTEAYTNDDKHHVVTLKCGHLFGRSCLETWLKQGHQNQRCPHCNKPAKKRDILKIYARNLRPLDTSERDEYAEKLKKFENSAAKLETENRSIMLENRKLRQENEELKSRLMNCQCHSNFESKKNRTKFPKISPTAKSNNFQLAHIREIDLKHSGARHHCYFKLNDSLIANVSRNEICSPLNFSNFGFIKQSLQESNNSRAEYFFMHKKPIKGMAANQQDASLVTVSADKTLKINSIVAKITIASTSLDYEPCSVEINPQSDVVFVGMKNGMIDVFDRRYLNQPMKTFTSHVTIPSPVVSMSVVHCRNPETKALLAVHLDSVWLHAFNTNSYDAQCVPLPYTGKSISCDHDPKSGQSLISFRPSLKHQKMTHYVLDWSYDPHSKAIQPCLNKKLEGGSEQIQMARSKIHSNPLNPGSVLVCGPDDRACGAMIWDCKSDFSQPISTYRPLFDFHFIDYSSSDFPILSCLGDSFLKLYKMY